MDERLWIVWLEPVKSGLLSQLSVSKLKFGSRRILQEYRGLRCFSSYQQRIWSVNWKIWTGQERILWDLLSRNREEDKWREGKEIEVHRLIQSTDLVR